MPSMTIQYHFPETPEDFESLCLRIYRKHWDVPNFQKYGRRGDKQFGGDLLGTDTQGRACFIQCKHRERGRAMTQREAEADIEAAKALDPKVDRYGIATTAKRNPKIQTFIAKKNAEHHSAELFSVELDSWDDINELLNQYPDIAASVYGPELSAIGLRSPMSVQQQGTINVAIAHLEVASGQGAALADLALTGLHAEIDAAAKHNTDGKPETAIELLRRLQSQQWDRADARGKYRILANIGHAHRLIGNYAEAARAYLQAKQFQPDDENARWMEALAYTLQGQFEAAHRLAAALVRDFPEFSRATAVWVGSAPPEVPFRDIEAAVPLSQRGDAEVAINLAYQAAQRRQWGAAEGYARKALEKEPHWTEARVALATYVFASQIAKTGGARFGALAAEDRPRIEESLALLSSAIKELPAFTNPRQKARLQVDLAGMHQMLGHDKEAGETIVAAHLAAPEDAEVQRVYASYLMDAGRLDEAVSLLRCVKDPSLGCLLLMAQALAQRKHAQDEEEALRLLDLAEERLSQLEKEPVELRTEWVRSFLHLHLYRQAHDVAAAALARQAGGWLRSEEKLAWEAEIALAAGDKANATEKAKRAASCVAGDTPPLVLRQLAITFHRLEAYPESLDLWLRITRPDHVCLETDYLMDCAQRTGHEDVVLDFCRRLRETGVFEPRYIRGELAILCEVSPLEMLRLLGELLEAPIGRAFKLELRAWRSFMAIESGKAELVDMAPDHMPPVADLQDARTGRAVVEVLRQGPDPMAAVRYAYELFRKFPNELDAHMAVVASSLISDPVIPEHEFVKAGTAVLYKEEDSGEEVWIVIEDSAPPQPALLEQDADTPIARALAGRRKGDAFVLRDRPRKIGVVRDIVDKYVYRIRECFAQMEPRFPGTTPIFSMHIPTKADGTPDVEKALGQIKEVCGDTGKADRFYQGHLMPLHVLGRYTGGSVFEVVQRLAGRGDMTLKCCVGARNEREAAFAALQTASAVVIGASALAALYMLTINGVLSVNEFLKAAPYEYILSEHTLLALRRLWQSKFQRDGDQLAVDVSGDKPAVHHYSAEQVKREREGLSQFIAMLESSCTVAHGISLVTKGDQDKKTKEAAQQLLGKEGVDSALLAAEPGRVLWTDDLATAALVCRGLRVRRAWTQAVFFSLAERGYVARKQEQKVTMFLLRAGYVFTSLRPDHVTAAGEEAGWDVDAPEMRPFISYFGSRSLNLPSRLSLASGVLKNIWQRGDLKFKTEAVTFRILAALRTVPQGEQVIDALIRHADDIFGLDVTTAKAFRLAAKTWLQTNRRIILP